jgi:hypothetical protein
MKGCITMRMGDFIKTDVGVKRTKWDKEEKNLCPPQKREKKIGA